MNETRRTAIYIGAALTLAALAYITAPSEHTPDSLVEEGENFFPEFTDPNSATALEVVEWDAPAANPKPFKVSFENGKWTIPSHNNYPCDGKERLAKTAAAVIEIRKDEVRSDNPVDHISCGVVDPTETTSGEADGRGQRVTLKGAGGGVLADIIIGKQIEGRPGFRFVRRPGEKRVYAAGTDITVSTKFVDWIDTDLLRIEKDKLEQITLNDYSIDETSGRVNQRDRLQLRKDGADWSVIGAPKSKQIENTKLQELLKTLDELTIVGVRLKPEGLSQTLSSAIGAKPIGNAEMLSLQSKGYYFARDGQLLSNEGEMIVKAGDGVIYTLRFGEVVYGSGEDISAGSEKNRDTTSGPGENRYLFVTTNFDRNALTEPPAPSDLGFQKKADSAMSEGDRANRALFNTHQSWQTKVDAGQKQSDELNARFAAWYYVISAESFGKLRLKRSDLLIDKKA